MKIAVNTRLLLSKGMDGIGWFSFHILQRIVKAHPEHDFLFIFDRKYDKKFIFADNVTPIIVAPPTRHPLLIWWWLEMSLPSALKKHQADIFVSPDGYLSLRSKLPQLAVIHDLNFHYFANDLPFSFQYFYTNYFPKYAKKATRIATVSEYSKKDIHELYGIEKNKIDVVYNGVNEIYKPISETVKTITKNKHTAGKPYFIFVGTLLPRKNVANLLRAFKIFKENTANDFQLILVGNKKFWTKEMENSYQNLGKFKPTVIFKSWTSPEDLVNLVGAATAVLYPSKFEGFGVPIVEGMRTGVPVITANNTSMPEVANGAALLVDDKNSNDIAEKMKMIISDKNLAETLVDKGMERANYFSWNKSAELLWESIEKMIKE